MNLVRSLTAIKNNKAMAYVISRYIAYGIQFINSLFIAVALGPIYLATWGFINLVWQYIAQINFGIPYSLSVSLSIEKTNPKKMNDLMLTSLGLYLILALFVIVVFVSLHLFGLDIGHKYDFNSYSLLVIAIALLTHFNTIFTHYFRIINRLWEIIFFQSLIPISMLLALFLSKGEALLTTVLWIILMGQLMSLFLYATHSSISLYFPSFGFVKPLLRKGVFLFLYNVCFYFILLSMRTIISNDYDVLEFGLFTFSFTLANSIMLLFDSFSFLIYPKTINRLNKTTTPQALHIFKLIQTYYITSIHGVMYGCLFAFPILIRFFPAYQTVFQSFGFIALSIIFYSNCFPYSSFLTAQGKERLLSVLASLILAINIGLAFFFSRILHVPYQYVILATLISYMIYNFLLCHYSYRLLKTKASVGAILKNNFPPKLFIPYAIALLLVALEVSNWYFLLAFGFFAFFNWKEIKKIGQMGIRILHDPTIINI